MRIFLQNKKNDCFLSVTFDQKLEWNGFNIFVEICFGLDIILRFFHAYKDSQTFENVTDIKLIAL